MTLAGKIEWIENGKFEKPVNKPLKGLPVCIIGGGPSLTKDTVSKVAGSNLILVNNSYLLFNDPQVVVALDRRWFGNPPDGFGHGMPCHAMGHEMVTAMVDGCYPNVRSGIKVHRMQKVVPDPKVPTEQQKPDFFTPDRRFLTGKNSGHAAINLAVHLGATRIYLAGFDMTFRNFGKGEKSHWHGGHPIPASKANYDGRFKPRLEKMVRHLWRMDVQTFAITPSAADIPHMPLHLALEDLHNEKNRLDNASPATPLPK